MTDWVVHSEQQRNDSEDKAQYDHDCLYAGAKDGLFTPWIKWCKDNGRSHDDFELILKRSELTQEAQQDI